MSPFAVAMTDYLAGKAAVYFPDLSGARVVVSLTRAAERELSSVYRFDLRANGRHHSVIVKRCGEPADPRQQSTSPDGPPGSDRPRIGVWTRPELLWQFERATLSAIKEHFDGVGDPRFGSVRLLDVLPDDRAIVMERLECPSLRDLLMQTGWRYRLSSSARLGAALRNAGGWLRAYQQIAPIAHTKPRFTTRTEFVDSIGEFVDYLEPTGGGRLLRSVVSRTEAAAFSLLPEELPTGLGHGDFAPRNVLVGLDDRVFVIDTVGKWLWPIYQDLAYFLTAMKTIGPQLCSGGLLFGNVAVAAFEEEFLRGYFADETPPVAVIRLFEIQCLMARWCSAVNRHVRATGAKKVVRRVDLAFRAAYYRRCLGNAIASLDVAETVTRS